MDKMAENLVSAIFGEDFAGTTIFCLKMDQSPFIYRH